MLYALIHGKRAKDHQKEKQIVNAEGFFDQVAGKEFQGRLGAAEIEHPKPKEDGDCDPAETGEAASRIPILCGRRWKTRRSNAMAITMKRLNAIQLRDVPMAALAG